MSRFVVSGVVAILLLRVSMLPNATPQQPKETPPTTTVPLPSYPESPDGLKKLIEDIFGAVKSGNSEKASSYFSTLTIPDHNAWFVKTFGPAEGPRLETKYEELLPGAPHHISQAFEYALKGDRTVVGVSVMQKPAETSSGLGRAIIEAMVQPTPLYIADGRSRKEKYPAYIGDFIYVDGGFRYLDQQVSQALSTAPPIRIRVGGNVQLAKLIHKVDPTYPAETNASHTRGTVVLHVVLATDGTPKEVQIVSGDPVLGKAGVEAVRKWQYQPTLLNGKSVEVDTTITIEFRP
jgi:TonB family protein